jgi:hypothetical protein
MSSEAPVNYVAYELYPKQYVAPPSEFSSCPACGGALSKSTISPSKAVTSFLDSATMPYHNFSHLYECSTCHWWAVWESFGDAEYSPDLHVLLARGSEDDYAPRGKPWSQALENERAYDGDMLLPKSIEQVLIGGKKRILDLPKPGDKVRLAGDVHMLQDPEAIPFELIPLFIGGSEGTVIGDEELYVLIKVQHLEPEYARNLLKRFKAHLHARNCCPIRLEKLVVSEDRWHRNSCKEGEVYLIDAADLRKMD